MEIKNDLWEKKNVLIAALGLIILGILGSLFVWENSGRDEDADFAGSIRQQSSQSNIQQGEYAQNQIAKGADAPSRNISQTIANPASENCIEKGGTLTIKERPVGQYGVCIFDDNRQCEEWAMFRGECPIGGLKITGYATDAAIYCVITGGEYAIKEDKAATVEQGNCKFKTGKVCDVWQLWNGNCVK